MRKYWKYMLFSTFLDFVKDCTFATMEDLDLTAVLNNITKSAIEDFLFPKIPLTYEYDSAEDEDETPYGYWFVEDVTHAELQVLMAYMKVYWVEMQLYDASNFSNPFFDKNIKGYSPANMLKTMNDVLRDATATAQRRAFNYSRKDDAGKPALGGLHANNNGHG